MKLWASTGLISILLGVYFTIFPALAADMLSDADLDEVSAAGNPVAQPPGVPHFLELSDEELEVVDGEGFGIPYVGLPLEAAYRFGTIKVTVDISKVPFGVNSPSWTAADIPKSDGRTYIFTPPPISSPRGP